MGEFDSKQSIAFLDDFFDQQELKNMDKMAELKEEKKADKVKEVVKKDKAKKEDKEKKPSNKELNRNKLNERIKVLNETKKFNILPDINVDDEEIDVLKAIVKDENKFDYTNLCRILDCKPSKLDKMLKKLIDKNLIIYDDAHKELTELGISFSNKDKDKKNRNKKFQKFIEILSDEEFNAFVEAVKTLKTAIK